MAGQGRRRLIAAGPALILWIWLDALGVVLLVFGAGTPRDHALAATLHMLAVGGVWIGSGLAQSHRVLLSALALSLPLVGALLAVLALATRGRGDLAQAIAADTSWHPPFTIADVCRLTDGLPIGEALVSPNQEERRATLALLASRADAASVAMLRWAASGSDPDLTVEAALVLEDMGTRHDTRALAARQALERHPGFEEAMAAADTLAETIHSGLADASLLAPLMTEARRYYSRAESFAPVRLPEIAVKWARLEMSALCPALALSILDRARAAGGGHDVEALHAHASTLVARRASAVIEPFGGRW